MTGALLTGSLRAIGKAQICPTINNPGEAREASPSANTSGASPR
jgi:hypothetical protein